MVEISVYSGEIINRTARDRGLVSVYPLYYRAEESHPSYDRGRAAGNVEGNRAGYTRGFRAAFNAAPYSVTPVTATGCPIGQEWFFETQQHVTNNIYNNPDRRRDRNITTVHKELYQGDPRRNVAPRLRPDPVILGMFMVTNNFIDRANGNRMTTESFAVRMRPNPPQTGNLFQP